MTAEVFAESRRVYCAYCEECDWEGEDLFDESDAKREMEWHNKRCTGGGEPDDRDERQKFQDILDEACQMTKGAFA